MNAAPFVWPSGKKLIVYHTAWSGYDRKFQVKDLPINYISDINYGFWNLVRDPKSGYYGIATGDAWADYEKRFTGPDEGVTPPDTWNDDNKGLYGNFGQFKKLKDLGIRYNLGISIGGWSWSSHFSDAVVSPQARQFFVQSIISFLDRYPIFNRVDIDWEYISPPGKNYGLDGNVVRGEDPHNFAEFLALLRSRLNETGRGSFEISACIASDPVKMNVLPLQAMVAYLTTINVMTYDLGSSSWGAAAAGHHTNLKSTPYAPLSVELAVDTLLSRGVPASKIVIGAAFYSRGFANCDGLGTPSSGVVSDRSWEDGVCDYKTLPRPGAVEYWDENAKAGYSYDPQKRILNSYDTVQSLEEKCKYVHGKGLAGIIVWESSGDVPVNHPRSLLRALYQGLSGL
ncbi:glycoside hydrolase [Polychytrium aggregatum]|uniref:glycoside hydrolase n=1 Tax=Polychytrium aggregatum TaxID=110093 RepID=UPI0022FE4F66|nr:glycoside hydrolase [Polychytrium aggregatum]KAI9205685.1 glycoside hydrolase [Polychytrium aggregatum]